LKNIHVPESQHSEAPSHEPPATPVVLFDCRGMLASVDLDHEPSFEAREINDVGTHRNLTSKAATFDLIHAKSHPQPDLCVSHPSPEPPSTLNPGGRGGVHLRGDRL